MFCLVVLSSITNLINPVVPQIGFIISFNKRSNVTRKNKTNKQTNQNNFRLQSLCGINSKWLVKCAQLLGNVFMIRSDFIQQYVCRTLGLISIIAHDGTICIKQKPPNLHSVMLLVNWKKIWLCFLLWSKVETWLRSAEIVYVTWRNSTSCREKPRCTCYTQGGCSVVE